MSKVKKEVKLTFSFNGREMPVHGNIVHKYDKDNNLNVEFSVGTTKLDKIKLKFEELNYVEK